VTAAPEVEGSIVIEHVANPLPRWDDVFCEARRAMIEDAARAAIK